MAVDTYIHTRQVPVLPVPESRREHCTKHCSRRRYEPAGASRSYFIEAGAPAAAAAAAFYRPFSKVPSRAIAIRTCPSFAKKRARYETRKGDVLSTRKDGEELSYPAWSPKLRLSSDLFARVLPMLPVRGRCYRRPDEMEVHRSIRKVKSLGEKYEYGANVVGSEAKHHETSGAVEKKNVSIKRLVICIHLYKLRKVYYKYCKTGGLAA